jgi:trehalose 6-phosphate phosphatase
MLKLQEDTAGACRSPVARSRPPAIDPSRDALFLDLDGTLAGFEAHPDAVAPVKRRTVLLRRLGERLDGRLAIVTGRTVAEADRILADACPVVAGVHGLSIRGPDGLLAEAAPSGSFQTALAEASAFAADRPGLLVENKGMAVALHYRQAADQAEAVNALGRELAAQHDLHGQQGHMVFELRLKGADKGSAVERLMALAPFSGSRPIFVGDDLTDEDGFRAVRSLGGYSVLVGDRKGSEADHGLADVEAVLAWLEAAL